MYYTIQNVRPMYPNELYHHGVKGQKWGVRRFQNADGTLTAAGKKRYYTNATRADYRNLRADTVKAGDRYALSLHVRNKAQDRYNRAVDKGSSQQKIDKLRAKKKDAEASEKFWKAQNRNSMNAVITSRAGMAARGRLKNEKVSNLRTKDLKNGEKILLGSYSNTKERIYGDAMAALGQIIGGLPMNVAMSSLAVKNISNNYRDSVELASNFNRNKNYNKYKERKKSGYYKNK